MSRNSQLRLVEHYVSTQGEGPRVGRVTQFVRFAGCNLRCPLWPCDSQFAIDPALYRGEMYSQWPGELAATILQKRKDTGADNVCFTGGEPFLQQHDMLLEVLQKLKDSDLHFEAFTNGTFEIPERFFLSGLSPVMDWKLPGSGEDTFLAERSRNFQLMNKYQQGAVKFTVADEVDFRTALAVWSMLIMDSNVPVFVGPIWDKEGAWGAKNVVDLIIEHKVPWRLNVQVHNFIYGAQTRGT